MKHKLWLAGVAVLFAPLMAHAVELYTDFPKDIHPSERYVFYSHGKIAFGHSIAENLEEVVEFNCDVK